MPTLRVAVALVHLKEVASKQTGLIATCSCTDLHLYVLGVLRILRNEGNLDFLLQLGLQRLVLCQLLTGHLFHLGIILVCENVLGLLDTVQTGDVTFAGIHDVAQVLIFLRQFDEAVLVGNHIGVRNQGRYFLEACLQSVEFL